MIGPPRERQATPDAKQTPRPGGTLLVHPTRTWR